MLLITKVNQLFILLFILSLSACGSSVVTTSTSEATTSSDTESTSGTSAVAGTGFLVSGQLSSPSLSVSSHLLAVTDDSSLNQVTDILAVSPGTGAVTCKKIAVESDGSFDFRIDAKKPWFFYFFNRYRRGKDMFFGRFKSSTLDTIVPVSASGTADLGTVTLDTDTNTATSDQEHSEIISDLGLDSDTADTIGELDDVSRRYSNPDVDNDGEVDCEQNNASFLIDFHVRFNMLVSANNATVTDMIDNYFSESVTTADYQSTGIYLAYLNDFSSETTGTVTFTDAAVTTSEGGAVAAGTAHTDVTLNSFGSYNGFGVNTTSTSELPSGEIIYRFGDKELTFSDVQTPNLAELTAPTGRIFPFVKFNKADANCSSDCTLASYSYKWMIKTSDSWEEATLSELELLIEDDSPRLGFRVNGDSSKVIGFAIPITSVEGTILWEAENASLEGASATEFEELTTDEICHVGLSYDDKLGMRYFENIQNASGTCALDS